MTTLREAAQQALEAWDGGDTEWFKRAYTVMEALRAALAEPTTEYSSAVEPVQEPKPVEFDHGIGADRFKVVRGAFWWHVLIGDSPTEHGKFHSRASAEKMAADLLREFRNGAFVQHEAALAEPVQEPVAWRWRMRNPTDLPGFAQPWNVTTCYPREQANEVEPLYTSPPQRPAEPVRETERHHGIH